MSLGAAQGPHRPGGGRVVGALPGTWTAPSGPRHSDDLAETHTSLSRHLPGLPFLPLGTVLLSEVSSVSIHGSSGWLCRWKEAEWAKGFLPTSVSRGPEPRAGSCHCNQLLQRVEGWRGYTHSQNDSHTGKGPWKRRREQRAFGKRLAGGKPRTYAIGSHHLTSR